MLSAYPGNMGEDHNGREGGEVLQNNQSGKSGNPVFKDGMKTKLQEAAVCFKQHYH